MSEPGLTRVAADATLARLTGAVLFLTLALGLVVPDALDVGVAALVLLALIWLPKPDGWRRHDLHRLEWLFLGSVVLFVAAWLLAWALHGMPSGGTSTAQRIPKLLAAVPLYLFMRRVDGLETAWWNGLVAGAFIASGYALWFNLTGQVGDYGGRATGPTNPIYFGGFSMAFALVLIPRLADERQSNLARTLTAAAIILAFVANALSGSRGAWLAIPALLAVYLFTAGAGQPIRWRLGVPLVVLAVSLLVLLNPILPMSERLDETLADLSVIASGENGNGGIGLRVQLWEIAGGLIQAEPLTGTGPGSYTIALMESVQSGAYDDAMLRYDHPHNQYLSALIEGGIGLLAILILLLASPILLVSPLSRRYSRQCRYLAWSALASGVVIAVLALSESLFERNDGVVWFVFLAATTTALAAGSSQSRDDGQAIQ
ncbi:O-antigen ligase family protein [Wenzhouxiangella sp. EGI_FJ10305]|uniref:O-antigen ligase family protein n=1 Tax=Wenzhouxiangella sp. EGI_FJ10305 TaxID=3243768 RepID=UPI0035DD6B92